MDADEKVSQLMNQIGNELKLLWWQIEAWKSLFVVEQDKRHQLIQETAPGFFAIVQMTMAESILIFQCFLEVLSDNDSLSTLRGEIQAEVGDWEQKKPGTKEEAGPYASLKIARNKWLAHNDFDVRGELDSSQLGMPLTADDFVAAQRLAARL